MGELSSATGVAAPFECEYQVLVENYEGLEHHVHVLLDEHRPNKNREFFTCSIPYAINIIRSVARIKFEDIYYSSPEEIAQQKREEFEEAEKKRLAKREK